MKKSNKKLLLYTLFAIFVISGSAGIYAYFYNNSGETDPAQITDTNGVKPTESLLPSSPQGKPSSKPAGSTKQIPAVLHPSDKMVGLKNYSQTCFANSIFQLLYHSQHFRAALKAHLHGDSIKTDNKECADVARALEAIFKAMDEAKNFGKVINPKTFPALPPNLRVNAQFDSFEVFSYYNLFHGFDWTAFEVKERTYQVINGEIQEASNSNSTTALQVFLPEMDAPTKISSLVRHHYSPSPVELEQWQIFAEIRSAETLLRILALPETLIIQPKRFFQESGKAARKINAKIGFEPVIDLADYLDANFEGNRNETKYELIGFIKHQGTALRSGHYYSYFKRSDGTWVEINDSAVKIRKEKEMAKDFADGYMFMYNRIKTSPVSSETTETKAQQ